MEVVASGYPKKVGAGSEDWDERAKAPMPKDVRQRSKLSVADMLVRKLDRGIADAIG